ncbi:MAG: lipid-A-disaccharide synthase [Planctomycetia bacterium]|nr:lipid-A-disaccharide synthase [Planctomycetia bacterium]
MKIFFSVGEPSGDIHGANLIRGLKSEYARVMAERNLSAEEYPPLQCMGFGGEKMAAEGCEIHFDLTSLAVMWVAQVLWNIRKFFALADQAEAFFRESRPDAVILIDYPGFNWHIARRAKKYGIPVYYYSPPQIWAWMSCRVKKMKKWVDLVFSGLPFECRWLQKHGCCVEYVGHPFFDEVRNSSGDTELTHRLQKMKMSDVEGAERKMIALLPGSRTQEVKQNFATFLNVIPLILKSVPDVFFVVAPFREKHAQMIYQMMKKKAEKDVAFRDYFQTQGVMVISGHAAEIIQQAYICLSVSGSVSLELLYYEKPSVITYRVGRIGWWLQWFFRKVKYITLVNLLLAENPFRNYNGEYHPRSADRQEVLFPEYLSCVDRSEWIAEEMVHWLTDKAAYSQAIRRLQELKSRVAYAGAAQKAAKIILEREMCTTTDSGLSARS